MHEIYVLHDLQKFLSRDAMKASTYADRNARDRKKN